MKHQTLGQHLRALRRARGMSQAELAARSGVPQPTISLLESGRLVDVERCRRLISLLTDGMPPPVEDVAAVSLPAIFGRRFRWVAAVPDTSLEKRWNQARLGFGKRDVDALVDRLRQRPDADRVFSILASLNLDSSDELIFLARLLDDGWDFERASPLSLACRQLIRSRDSADYAGDAPRWWIHRRHEAWHVALTPQLTVVSRNVYRMDFLALVASGRMRGECNVEIDGRQHELQIEEDARRTRDLQLPCLRVTHADLTRDALSQRVLAFAAGHCQQRPSWVRQVS